VCIARKICWRRHGEVNVSQRRRVITHLRPDSRLRMSIPGNDTLSATQGGVLLEDCSIGQTPAGMNP
jgi:hypothetical protein